MLLRLWAENVDRLESREARKAWDDIAKKMNDKFGTKKTTDNYEKIMKYLVDRYKQAKDWNRKQAGGNRRKSAHYDDIDKVLSQHRYPSKCPRNGECVGGKRYKQNE